MAIIMQDYGTVGGGISPQTITQVAPRTDWNSPRTLSATLIKGKTYTLVFSIYGSDGSTVINNGGLDFTNCTGMDIKNVSYGYIGVWSNFYTAVVVTFKATNTSATLNLTPKSGVSVSNYCGEILVQLD